MCCKFLLYLINLKRFIFLKNITSRQQSIYVISILIFIVVGINFIEYIYHLKGLLKLSIFFILILFLVGAIFNTLKIVTDNLGDFKNNFMCIYYCIQFFGIVLALIFLILKFLILLFFILFG